MKQYNRISKENQDKICDLYLKNISCSEIAEKFHCTISSVIYTVKKHGVYQSKFERLLNLGKIHGITEIHKNKIKELNQLGKNYKEIASILELPENTVRKVGLKMGLIGLKSSGKRLYSLDQGWLDSIDSPEKAVFLGLFFADGSNLRNSKCSVYIHKNDKAYLEKLSTFFTDKPVYEYNSECISMICSKQWTENLLKYGAIHNKSLVLEWPKHVPDELVKYFVRGFFEGDGGFSVEKGSGVITNASFISTKEFLLSLQECLEKQIGVSSSIRKTNKTHDRNTYRLTICGIHKIKKFGDWIYGDKLEIAMERKLNLYKDFLKFRFPSEGLVYLNRRLRPLNYQNYEKE